MPRLFFEKQINAGAAKGELYTVQNITGALRLDVEKIRGIDDGFDVFGLIFLAIMLVCILLGLNAEFLYIRRSNN